MANTWGYGAMTNSYNDIRNARTIMVMGGNPAEAHPVSLQHILEGKEINRANMIVIDPRMTRTAAHATEYVRVRPGTHIATIYGMIWHILHNGWEDKEFIRQRVYGLEDVRGEVEKWTPDEVERVTGLPEAQVRRIAEVFAKERPATLIWAMGQTQFTTGTANVRASCLLLLVTGNVGVSGAGANIFRGHTNVQGATDLGLDVTSLPLYYGLSEEAWRHWCRVWEVDYDWMRGRFGDKSLMESPGIPSTRWFDATLLPKAEITQPNPLQAMFVMGHGANTITRMPESVKGDGEAGAVGRLRSVSDDLVSAVRAQEWHLPVARLHQLRDGWLTDRFQPLDCNGASRLSKPVFESRNDYDIIYMFAQKFGFADSMFKNIKVDNGAVSAEDLLREINRGGWSTGYCGQSPERLKAHMRNQSKFDVVTLRAPKDDPEVGGDYYGLPWPCWGKPELRHPGSPILYNTSVPVAEGGGTFRARFGVERVVKRKVTENGQEVEKELHENLLADGSYSVGSEIKDGYPEFTLGVLKKLGWDKDLTAEELAVIKRVNEKTPDAVSWATDLSGGIQRVAIKHGCSPYGNAQGAHDCVESAGPGSCASRADLHASPRPGREVSNPSRMHGSSGYPTSVSRFRKMPSTKAVVQHFPLILSSGRLVEYEGGGEETRSNKWLAELKQDMYVEINPADAKARGIVNNAWVWVTGAENNSKARMRRSGHRAGRQGRDVDAVSFCRLVPGRRPAQQVSARALILTYSVRASIRSQPTGLILQQGCRSRRQPCVRLSRHDRKGFRMARMKFLCDADRCIDCNACVTACKNENEVPWGVNRRRVVTINDGKPGERSVSMACMHCTDAPVRRGVPGELHISRLMKVWCCIPRTCASAAGTASTPARSARLSTRRSAISARAGKMDKCTFCAGGGGPEASGSSEEYRKYGANRLAQGKLPLCAEMCSTKSLLAGDGEIIAQDLSRSGSQTGLRLRACVHETVWRPDRLPRGRLIGRKHNRLKHFLRSQSGRQCRQRAGVTPGGSADFRASRHPGCARAAC